MGAETLRLCCWTTEAEIMKTYEEDNEIKSKGPI